MRWRWVILSILVLLLAAAFAFPLVATATPEKDVAFCLSCHVMTKQGEKFQTSFHNTHNDAATCSDCHTGSLVQKYTDGTRHFVHNTLGNIPEKIELRESSKEVVAGQCFECHKERSLHARTKRQKGENCLECHTGHTPRTVKLIDEIGSTQQ